MLLPVVRAPHHRAQHVGQVTPQRGPLSLVRAQLIAQPGQQVLKCDETFGPLREQTADPLDRRGPGTAAVAFGHQHEVVVPDRFFLLHRENLVVQHHDLGRDQPQLGHQRARVDPFRDLEMTEALGDVQDRWDATGVPAQQQVAGERRARILVPVAGLGHVPGQIPTPVPGRPRAPGRRHSLLAARPQVGERGHQRWRVARCRARRRRQHRDNGINKLPHPFRVPAGSIVELIIKEEEPTLLVHAQVKIIATGRRMKPRGKFRITPLDMTSLGVGAGEQTECARPGEEFELSTLGVGTDPAGKGDVGGNSLRHSQRLSARGIDDLRGPPTAGR
jgi:hypothetical protein